MNKLLSLSNAKPSGTREIFSVKISFLPNEPSSLIGNLETQGWNDSTTYKKLPSGDKHMPFAKLNNSSEQGPPSPLVKSNL